MGSVTVKAGGYLQSADLSSVHSTSTDVVIGSWGDHTAPEILSVTASEGGSASESGLGDGDIITVVFDKQTTLNAIDTKIGVDELFAFSAQIGDDYTAEWTSYTTVRITIVDATHAAAAELTRVGVLRLTVKAAYALQSADESSPVSTSTGVLAGTWLAHSAPVIVSCNASDGGSQEGIGNGDVITVVFDQETDSHAITTKADVDAVFGFTDPNGSVVNFAPYYTGAYAWDVLTGSVSVVTGSAVVSTSADVRGTLDRGDEVKIDNVVYRVSLSGVYNASYVSLDSAYGGSSSSSVQAYRRSRSTMLITIVDVCDQVMRDACYDHVRTFQSCCYTGLSLTGLNCYGSELQAEKCCGATMAPTASPTSSPSPAPTPAPTTSPTPSPT